MKMFCGMFNRVAIEQQEYFVLSCGKAMILLYILPIQVAKAKLGCSCAIVGELAEGGLVVEEIYS